MRTKTLVLTAAALAAGLASSIAQPVFSVNVVGYYNVAVPNAGYAFLANQLTNSGNNPNLILTNGPRSDINGVFNTVLYKWTGVGYTLFQYFTGDHADNYFGIGPGSPNGWYDAVGNLSAVTLDQGRGNYLFNPAGGGGPITNTLVGEVVQSSNNIPVTTGFNTYSIVPPIATNIDNALFFFPGTSDINGINNDTLYKFTGVGYTLAQYFLGIDADAYFGIGPGSPDGFYDAVGNYVSLSPTYIPKVGEAFFLSHVGAPKAWTYRFTVQ